MKFKSLLLVNLLAVVFAFPQQAAAAINLVQKSEAPPQETIDGITSSSATFPAPPTTGNLLVAIVSGEITGQLNPPSGWSTAVNQPFTVDIVGMQIFQIPSQAIFYKVATVAESATVTFEYPDNPDANVGIQIYEYSGIALVNPLSGIVSVSGHTDTDGGTPGFQISTGSILPTTAPALLITGFAARPLDAAPTVNNGTGNADFTGYTAGYTEQSKMSTGEVPCDDGDPGCYGFAGLDRITNALGSFSVSATLLPTQGGWRAQIAAFKSLTPTAAPASISGRIQDEKGTPIAGAVVRMSGTQTRSVITDAEGNYRFDNVPVGGFYTVAPARTNYSFTPGELAFNLQGSITNGMFVGVAEGVESPLNMPEFFVRLHYLDFLGREPDEAGFNFWSSQISSCGDDAACVERRTINASAAYFLSIEFQETGGFVDGLYRTSFARAPQYSEFVTDRQMVARDLIVGDSGWQNRLETQKQEFVDAWTQRADFRNRYDNMSDAQFVDALIGHTDATFSAADRNSLLDSLTNHTTSRGGVLRAIVENQAARQARFNKAFVLMEYFGYLRRDPDASGYQFWLNKLNAFDGDFERADMVKSFIVSSEYRDRFPR